MALPTAQPQQLAPEQKAEMFDLYLSNTRRDLMDQLEKAGAPASTKARKADLVAQLQGMKRFVPFMGREGDAAGMAAYGAAKRSMEDGDDPVAMGGLGGVLLDAASGYFPTIGYVRMILESPKYYHTPTDEDMEDAEYWQQGIAEMKLQEALKAAPQSGAPVPQQAVDPLQNRLRDAILGSAR